MAGVVTAGPKSATPRAAAQKFAPSTVERNKDAPAGLAQNTAISAKQAQATEQQQSLAMVQIMLHASFGTLFYLREFLPLSCFGECDLLSLSNSSGQVSYEDFSTVKSTSNVSESFGKRGQPLKTILRDCDKKADSLLDLLEHGIFEALAKNMLEAVQLTVFVDKAHPTQVLESYTFSFEYTGDAGDVNSRLAGMSLDSAGHAAETNTFRSTKHGLEMIIRRLITLSSFLPILPNKRYMEIHLFYTADCPQEYEPPGFTTASHDNVVYPKNDLWTKETQSCGTMISGFHSVGLKVTSLKWSGGEQGESASRVRIPDTIDYSETVARDQDIGVERPEDFLAASQGTSQQSAQTRQDEVAKKMLQDMLVSPTPDSDLTPTQANTQNMANASVAARPQLSQVKISEIRQERDKPLLGGKLASGDDTQAKAGAVVDCQCGLDKEDGNGDMIQCAFCGCHQHLTCYGFLHAEDPSIPDTHACYKCLLGPGQPSLLREMDTLVLLRRALKIIGEEGYPLTLKDFAQKLNCNGNTVVQVRDLLKRKGFLQSTQRSKGKGFAKKGLPKFKIPDSPRVRERLRKEIFNPLAKISHYYDVPESQRESMMDWSDVGQQESLAQCQNGGDQSAARESLPETASHGGFIPGNNPRAFMQGTEYEESLAPAAPSQAVEDTQASSAAPRAGADHSDAPSPELGGEENQQTRKNSDNSEDLRLRKKRKLSNIANPIDICDPMDEDSS